MRTFSVVVLVTAVLIASIGEISAITDNSELSTVALTPTTRSTEGVQDTSQRFLRKHKITDDYEDAGVEERAGEAAQLAAKLDGLLPTFLKVSKLDFDKAWHQLQSLHLTWDQRSALLSLHKLSPEDRKAVMMLVKS
ncbi:Secreted RxLR effector peptide protein [Phytophthora palmivora]|uniref:RxLR effector protein n=1 Tax=Phytophthora palmivora TaxID=4796 RepID=A0A2P4YDX1_9STRA|nr:Secreted RxLR effector peptide protein [Phytophthora palmivora]